MSRDRRLPDWLRFRLWADAGSKDAALKRAKPGRWRRWRIPSIAALSLTALLLAAFAALPPLQAQAQAVTPTTFVSNTGQIPEADASNNLLAQSFRTGANTDGYTVSDVHIRLAEAVDKNTRVKIRKDNSGEPAMGNGDLVATLTNPSGLTENSLNTFTAPADTTLDPNTRYWITVNEGITQTSRPASFVKTSGNGESGTAGWSIDNDLLFRATGGEAWGTASTPLLITIRGTTGTTNNAPVFADGTSTSRGFDEDIVPGSAFGGNVPAATDADGDTLTYTLEGGDAARFEMNSNRRLRTKVEEDYSYERRSTYYLKIKADDNNGGIATIDVTVNVGDVDEQPDKMARPLVWAPDNTTKRMELDWTEPGLGGGPDIYRYLIELNGGGHDHIIFYVQPNPTAFGITNLKPDTNYKIRMRARTDELDGAWSDTEYIRTNPTNDQVNDPPTFNEGNSPSRTLNETLGDRTLLFQSLIGTPVSAMDPEGDPISWYSLEGTDVAKFGFDTRNGQIKTKIGQNYDYESKPSYSVTVKARDDRGGVGTIDVTLRVNDNNTEAPLAPSEPTVTGTLGSTTSLDVSWTAPTNTGRPDIDTYNLRYRVANNGSWTDGPQDVTGTSATIGNLASDTSYRVQVQAISHEGNSGWSTRGDGQTNAQTADASLSGLALADNDGNAISLSPVFASGVTAYDALAAYTVSRITVTPTRSAADAAIGYLGGDDNALTDADTDADGFQVNLISGENTIKVQVTSGDGSTTQTYTVTVTRQTLTTFVSNTERNAQPNGPINRGAQSFVTGASAGGFTISEVEIRLLSGGGSNTRVRIREDNGSGEPATGDPVATLTNPATLTVGFKTFTAPPGTTLAPEKTYWISVNEVGGVALAITTSDDETGETGWSIGDTRLSINSATGNWRTENTSLMIEIRGTIGGYTASTDATLSDLALEDATGGNAITLTPGFASDEYEYEYDASMESTVSRITVTPTPSDANASITYLDGDDNVLTDAEMATDGQQVDLTAGENTIKVKVTAEDTTTTLTYTVTVTQEEDPLVSNTGESLSGSGTNSLVAQSFETGASVGGFTISEVQLRLVSVTDKSTSVRIREDDSGEPATGAPLATLTNPATLTANSLNTFTAPADTTLAASTTYWITANEGIPSADRASFQATNEDAETGETGWSIGDGRLYRSGETDSWTTQLSSLLIAIRGTTGGYVASTDATLKTLALEGATGGETIDLSPAFDAGTGTYTASVVNRIDSVKLTATKNDSNATVVITDDDDTGTPEEAELDLIVGSNTLTVTVTAEDGTPQTYTITVTRDAAPPVPTDCPADTDWCTTMTVGYVRSASSQPIIESFGYRADANFGDLGSTMFSHGGTPYSVTGIYRLKVSSLDGNPVNTDKLNLTVSPALPDGTIYQVGSRTFAVGTDSATSTAGQEQWDLRDNPPSWTAAQHVTVSLKLLDPGVTVSPTALTVTEEDTTGDSYTVVLDSQPTADVEVMVAGYSGTAVTPTPSTLTFTSVNWDMSQTVTVKAGADTDTENDTVTLTHSAASTDSDYDGSSITIASVTVTVNDDDEDAPAAGICGRMEEVRDALVELIPGVSDCAAVTDADLAAITGPLDLSSQNITALAAGDFAGLTALTELDLNNNGLTGLTADVFAGLTALEILYLHNNGPTELTADLFARLTALEQLNLEYNQLTTLPVGVFAGLTMLEQLNLENNQLTTLPVGVFEGLSSLDILGLDNNELNTLPAGVFDGLSSLRSLSLHDNQLNTLPVGVFDGLTALTLLHLRDNKLNRLPGRVFEPLISLVELWLVDNPGVPFAPTADALPDDGTVSNAGGTVTLDGSGSDGGPWGTNVTYAWALTTPTSGVTFDDATSATPEVTIQAPTAGAELIFTLTVTGRGDRASGTAVATDTATVTVNSPATGAPTISGTAEVGKMLTAGISAIMDVDGVPGSLTYQWVRVDSDGSNTAEISGATSNTYLLVAADVGKRLKVKVSFTDNAANSESLTSDAYPSSGTIVPETANTAPTFDEGGSPSRTFNETIGDATVGTASDIGTPVSATDPDTGDTLEYSLEGTDRTKFGINATSGQIRTKVGENYDYEARTSYSVTVTVNDGTVTVSSAVTINVTDQDEPPPVMNQPVVTATANSTTSLEVSWTAPSNPGRPDIESYDLQYRAGSTGDFSNGPQDQTGSSAAIGNLTADTSYEVRVRATNAEGDGVWSPSGTGTTGRTTITTDPPGVTVSPTALTVTEEDTAGDSYRVVLDSQPTAEVVVTVAGHAGTEVTPSPTSLTFTRSNWDTAQTVTVTAGSDADTVNDTVTLTHGAASADSNYDGNSITIASVTVTVNDDDIDTTAGICGRTEEVRDALLAQIPGGSDCAAVTDADLAAITDTLNLSGQNISALAAGDFAGLTGLTELYLNNNGLTTLPKDVFAGLTALKVLTLYYNELTTLPDGVFGQLTSLNFLYLGDNPRAPFAPTAVARPDAGTVLVAGGTVTLDGSGSGGPWGTNVTYRWALTTPASGVRVTFDDSTSATPEVTIPTLAAGTELTFTLTVTGRGGTDGIETATDTARVTATQNITNNPPVFAGGAVQARTFDETIGDTAVTSASDIGTPVSATDPDTGDTLEYSLLGADRAKFTFDTSSGQIKTRAGESYDYEARTSYSVRVAVTDGTVTVSSAVTINVTDQDEPPPVMNKPVVTATANSTTSLEVSWTEPSNPGRPRIGSYDLQYRVGSNGGFSNGPQDQTGSSAAIGNLTADTEYQVRVRATNAEGDGVWSPSGTGTTGRTTITTDPPGVTVSETALTVTEEDTAGDSYRVVLDSQPTAEVVVTVAGHAGTEVTPSPTSLTFTRSNWETGQTVTVTAGSDADTVNDTVTLTHSAASADSDYDGNSITIASVTVTVTDDDIDNAAPTFNEGGSPSRTFNETVGDETVGTASDIGTPVSATDPDTGDTLEYSLEGTDRTKFGINATSGQIRTKVGENYDYEARTSYSVRVAVNDGTVTVSSTVTINVTDQDEPPPVMNQPVVTATANSTTSLEVSWTAPSNPGRPDIESYDLQYRAGSTGDFSNGPQDQTGSSAAIGNLTADTSYEVRVRATNAEGDGVWSPSGTGTTGRTTITTDPPGVTVSPTALTVTEEDTAGDSYRVVLDSQPTAEVVVTVAGHAGTEVTPSPTSLTFTRSNWDTAQTVTVTAGSDADTVNDTVTLTHGAASADSNYDGNSITIASVTVTVNDDDIDTTAGICGRTEEVRDALLAQIPGGSDCAAVTDADLAAITDTLNLSGQNISALAAGDFAGLTGLTELYLNNNGLTTLPKDVFAGLTALKVLTLYYNELTTLPDGVFGQLTSLNFLYLGDNPRAPFAPTAVARPDAGTVLVAGGTVTLDGSGSGGPWGTNVTYRWALTTPASGVRVTFDDSTSATPEVTIPTLAAGTELTFTLTVTGRGGTDGIETATDTARVTATQNITNNPPVFAGGAVQARTFDETIGDTAVTSASDIGTPVSATDPDTGDTLEYSLLGADRAKFTFDTSSGQIKTRAGESYDYEARTSYSVRVAVIDGTVTVSSAVTINVTDQDEPPPVMNKPVVTATANSTTSLEVSWTEPPNPGRPRIGSYDLQYRVGSNGGFSNGPQDQTGSSAAIGNLTADTEYQVRVRATNAEGDGVWSPSGTGTTGRTTITTDPPGVTVSETALTVTEEDTAGDSYRVVLDSQPTAEVVVTVAGHAGTEVTPSPTSLTFTRSNWETGQTVTVTAGSDADTVNDTVTLTHSAASADSDYDGNSITIASVTVTVTDDDIDNAAPTFNEGGSPSRTFNETVGDETVGTASDIGTPVSATDPDTGDTLEYSLEGTDRTKFGINATSGQIRTKVGENYDYEARTSYSVRVAVNDGTVTVSSTVTINVTDQDEPPPVMNQPVVTATANSTTSLEVSWTAPSNPGRPDIESYDLQYRAGSTGDFSNGPQDQTGSSAAIGNLTADTSYEVRVRATNAEGDGVWSPSGTGTTGRTTITTDPPGVTVSPTALTVTEEDTAGDSYRVVLDSQPTAEVVVTVAGHAGTEVTPSPTSLTFTRSNWDTAQTVTVTAGSDADTVNDTVTLTHGAASADSNYDGNSITIASVTVTVNDDDIDTTAGICGRTEEVRDALLAQIPGGSDCAAVTDADLAAITDTLNLSGQNISALAAGDFAGLTGLTELYLNNNGLTTLPKDVFAGLTALKVLTLYYNELTTLPDGVFGQLTSLNFLYLGDNPRAPFAPTAVARPDAGTVLVAGGTVTLDGSGSGGPWGTNVTYRWALTTPASGVRVTFDDSTSATPEVTIPTLAAGTELTFTLTVTGRGGTDGIETATDTARVTATDSVTASGDVTLGPLRVNDGTGEQTLAPAFASGTFASMRRRWATRSRPG